MHKHNTISASYSFVVASWRPTITTQKTIVKTSLGYHVRQAAFNLYQVLPSLRYLNCSIQLELLLSRDALEPNSTHVHRDGCPNQWHTRDASARALVCCRGAHYRHNGLLSVHPVDPWYLSSLGLVVLPYCIAIPIYRSTSTW